MTLSSKDIKRILEKHGFVFSRQRGSHQQFVGFVHGKKHRVTVIANQKKFAPGTLRSMIRQSGISENEFVS
ncbi:MAG: type II toxin-antitoxin system HicA family toxin [Candidatus Omnitrophica bacterium]|nr:type II toxin-antitoxin system HicA family toxin [Candidatus Omnitrophota bacterium]